MTAVEELEQWKKEAGVTHIHYTPGFDPNVTDEQRAREMLDSIKRIEQGDFTVVSFDGSDEEDGEDQSAEVSLQLSFNPAYHESKSGEKE